MESWDQRWRRASEQGDTSRLQQLMKELVFESSAKSFEETLASKMMDALRYQRVLHSDQLEPLLGEAFLSIAGSVNDLRRLVSVLEEKFATMRDPEAKFITAVQIRDVSTPLEAIRRLTQLMTHSSDDDAAMLMHQARVAIGTLPSELRTQLENDGPLPRDVDGWVARMRQTGIVP